MLAAHVDDAGLVDYSAMAGDTRFREYLYRLAHTDPTGVGDGRARLAFWINAYNALVVQGVVATLPADRKAWYDYTVLSVEVAGIDARGKGFFEGLRFVVGGRRYSLDEIEHAVLLQRPERMGADGAWYRSVGPSPPDVRIHFALVCAARGCPKLRREAYGARRIDEQLAAAVTRFVRDADRVRFDRRAHTMRVSELLAWYGDDLTNRRYSGHAGSVAAFLARYVDDPALARSLGTEVWRTEYLPYDWSLNVRR